MALQMIVTLSPVTLTVWMTGDAAMTTLTVKLRAALRAGEPSSVTRATIRLVLGPCASVGVQVSRPLLGLIVAPAGAPGSRLNASALAGRSGSVARFVTTSVLPSRTV